MRLFSVRVRALGSLVLPLLAVSVGCSSSDDDDRAAAGSSGSSGHAGASGQAGSAGSGGQLPAGSAGAPASKGLALTAAGPDATTCQLVQTLGGPAATCVVTVTNQGTRTVTFGASPVSVTGVDAALFTVATPPTGTLAAGASTTLTVSLAVVEDESARTATLTVTSDSGQPAPTLALKGRGACPTKGPIDLTVPVIRDHCTQTLHVAVGERTRRVVSPDLTTWSHDQLDHTNCLSNADGTLNCLTKTDAYDCSKKDPKECKDLGAAGLDCTFPDATDPKVINCTGFDDGAFNTAFGMGLMVTASDFGIFTSADAGATWTKAPAPAPQQWGQGTHVGEVAFGNGRWVVASGGTTFTSSDGYVWTKSTDELGGGYYGFGQFLFGGGHFVATGAKKTKVTEDGTTWHDSVDLEFGKLAHGNGVFVGGGSGLHAWSVDGTNWQTTTDVCTADEAGDWTGPYEQCVGGVRGLVWTGNRFVMCGTNCVESTDGKTWKGIAGTHRKYGFPFYYMIVNGSTFLASGGGANFATSTDLITWDGHDFPKDSAGAGRGIQNVSVGTVLRGAPASP